MFLTPGATAHIQHTGALGTKLYRTEGTYKLKVPVDIPNIIFPHHVSSNVTLIVPSIISYYISISISIGSSISISMSSNDEIAEKNKAADNILEMLREAGVSTESLEEKRHAFWDTQVSVARVCVLCLCVYIICM